VFVGLDIIQGRKSMQLREQRLAGVHARSSRTMLGESFAAFKSTPLKTEENTL
jgi:hypothetical protein